MSFTVFTLDYWRQFLICALLATTCSITTLAQYSDSLTRKEKGWIEDMDEYLAIKFHASNELEAFMVDAGDFEPELFPNTSTTLNVGFNYRFLSFTISHAPKFLPGNNDDDIKGRTKNFGLSIGIIHPHWFTAVSYSRNKGYYLRNTDEFSSDWQTGDPFLLLPDMKVSSFEGITGYSFNRRYSVRALTIQTERQLRSAGTFVPLVGYRLYFVDNLNAGSGQKSQNLEFVAGAGYHYTYVLKSTFYASFGLTPGAGYIFTKLTTRGQSGAPDDIVTNNKAPILRLEGRFALGYNGERFFAGIYTYFRDSVFKQEGTTAINTDTHIFYQAFLGYRFQAPSDLRRALQKIPIR